MFSTCDRHKCISLFINDINFFSVSIAFIYIYICDRISENPAYCPSAHMAQCAFIVPQVKKCQNSVFVIFMSKNLSTNLCCRLWRVNVSYQGEISHHFDLPSLYNEAHC